MIFWESFSFCVGCWVPFCGMFLLPPSWFVSPTTVGGQPPGGSVVGQIVVTHLLVLVVVRMYWAQNRRWHRDALHSGLGPGDGRTVLPCYDVMTPLSLSLVHSLAHTLSPTKLFCGQGDG